jgi:hypothetical protein
MLMLMWRISSRSLCVSNCKQRFGFDPFPVFREIKEFFVCCCVFGRVRKFRNLVQISWERERAPGTKCT